MIEIKDATKVLETLARDLVGVSKNEANFQRLPDTFWGYFARGHDAKGKFGIIVTYSEDGSDVDNLIKMYEEWASRAKSKSNS